MEDKSNAIAHRWEQWRRANNEHPLAREQEIQKLFTILNPSPGEKIWEAGTGNGNLTLPLAEGVGREGEIITTDVQPGNTALVTRLAQERNLPIQALLLPVDDSLLSREHYGNYFDAVASIATLHHFDDRIAATGERGRIAALKTFYAMLRPGGRLVLADVLQDSLAGRYFGAIDDPRHAAPHGHPHDFFTKERLLEILQEVGFTKINFELTEVPWQFNSKEEATAFVHKLHNAVCPEEESFAIASEMLGYTHKQGHYELGWDLFFVSAQK